MPCSYAYDACLVFVESFANIRALHLKRITVQIHQITNLPVTLSITSQMSTCSSVERSLNICSSSSRDFRMYVLHCSQDLNS